MQKTLMETMTLRQWYAGQALAGLMANPQVVNPDDLEDGFEYDNKFEHQHGVTIEKECFHRADMLIALEEQEQLSREISYQMMLEREREKRIKRDIDLLAQEEISKGEKA